MWSGRSRRGRISGSRIWRRGRWPRPTALTARGYNLQRADRCIFAEWSWSNETNLQAEKRASRKGSTKEFVRCEYLVCPGSMDEVQLGSCFTKEKRVKRVIG